MRQWLMTIFCLVASVLLTRWVPFSDDFRNVSTLVHEFGHAAATLLTQGDVQYIHLFADHSGVTLSSITKSWSGVPVAIAGYTTASLFSVLLFYWWRTGRQREGLVLMGALAAFSLALFVRNEYGMIWTAGFLTVTVIAGLLGRWVSRAYYLVIAFLCLEESVFGALTVWIAAVKTPKQAGDATLLAEMTGVPAPWWGFGLTVFALLCARSAIVQFVGRRKHAKPRADRSAIR
ncbi:M50 family metallopeptidase [Paenibacillus thermoaerophilus]|uniref:M50 family metallopeptidase n=1 Tax=Paenibacillus thermoaerophilus TaxID=1215385 RepID=A0ABW2V8C0_9BACL|nr:M50 family metallopeptidase [Paenibacillus thermoaerophilus]TMV08421.1 M50 family metallopeptidase [Paenibacillus thermoaerophilus]